jgi:putative ABC transport system ATP-binding protein
MSGLALTVEGVTRSYDRGLVRALTGVDLSIRPGETVALVGPTGAGKSTLLAILGRIEVADGGRLLVDGAPPAGSAEAWRASNVGVVFQFHHLLPHLTVLENVALPLWPRFGKVGALARAAAILEDIGLSHRGGARAATLSGGERQMSAVARALVGAPRLVLADEPTGSVDSIAGARVVGLLREWAHNSGGTLILATHDRALAAACARIVPMKDGRIEGTPVQGVTDAVSRTQESAAATPA